MYNHIQIQEKLYFYCCLLGLWHPHRYEGLQHSTQDLEYICQNRDNVLIDITDCPGHPKSGVLLCLYPKYPKWGTSGVPKGGLTHFLDSLCIMHLMYVYIHESFYYFELCVLTVTVLSCFLKTPQNEVISYTYTSNTSITSN